MKMETTSSSETWDDFESSARHYIPEDKTLLHKCYHLSLLELVKLHFSPNVYITTVDTTSNVLVGTSSMKTIDVSIYRKDLI
jgi:hypothetical protein